MKIVKYKAEYQKHFEHLNKAWLNKYFEVEPLDEKLLFHPEETILKNGGHILFAEHQGQIIGTVALIFINQGVYELAKMAVDEAFQGIGAGKFLCRSAIEEAKKLNTEKLILFTNSKLKTAINIYHKYGFKDIPLDEQQFKRADTKMELILKTATTKKWFDRKFDFNFGMEQYDNLLERLQQAPILFDQILSRLPENVQILKLNEKWSIKENIGHLIVLEPLWRIRFQDIKEKKFEMSPADLGNTLTNEMNFNRNLLQGLLKTFSVERNKTLGFLKTLEQIDFSKTSIHPRLQQPMRIIDLMYFVAEHDQHHLEAILNILNTNWQQSGYFNPKF